MFRFILWVVGWVAFAGLCYIIHVAEVVPAATLYDPYAILEISPSATEDEIRKVYKRLSLKW
jgi:translocation protein SEC63